MAERRLVFGHLPRTRQAGVPLLAQAAHRRGVHCPERVFLERVFPVVRVGSLFAHALDSGNTTTIVSVNPLIFKMQAITLCLVSHPTPSCHSIAHSLHRCCTGATGFGQRLRSEPDDDRETRTRRSNRRRCQRADPGGYQEQLGPGGRPWRLHTSDPPPVSLCTPSGRSGIALCANRYVSKVNSQRFPPKSVHLMRVPT